MQAEALATAQALRELRALLEGPAAAAPLGAVRERAVRCAEAARALRAREREVSVRARAVQRAARVPCTAAALRSGAAGIMACAPAAAACVCAQTRGLASPACPRTRAHSGMPRLCSSTCSAPAGAMTSCSGRYACVLLPPPPSVPPRAAPCCALTLAVLPWQLQGAREAVRALGVDAATDGSGKRLAEGMRQVGQRSCPVCLSDRIRAMALQWIRRARAYPLRVGADRRRHLVACSSGNAACARDQVREQDMKLQRDTARLEALSFALTAAKARVQRAADADPAPAPALPCSASATLSASAEEGGAASESLASEHASALDRSAARRFYLQLKTSSQQQRSAVPEPAGHAAEHGDDDGRQADMLAALRMAVVDTVADNVALARTDQGFCCSFTTRRSGMSARIHVQDGGENGAVSMAVSCDLFLAGACERAHAMLTAKSSAEAVVQEAFWPALSRLACPASSALPPSESV